MNKISSPTLSIISKCNNNCPYCFQSIESHNSDAMLSIEEIRDITKWIKQDFNSIVIMGGEPLLHPEIEDIMKYISNNYYKAKIITNLILDDINILSNIIKLGNINWLINTTTNKNNTNIFNRNLDLILYYIKQQNNMNRNISFSVTFTGNYELDCSYIDRLFLILKKVPFEHRKVRLSIQMPSIDNKEYKINQYDKQFLYLAKSTDNKLKISQLAIDCGLNLCFLSEETINFITKKLNIGAMGPGCTAPFIDINVKKKLMYCNFVSERLFPRKYYWEYISPSEYIKSYTKIKEKILKQYKYLCKKTYNKNCKSNICWGVCPALIDTLLYKG